MTNPGPRAGGPSRRRTFTLAEKLALFAGYEAAITEQQGGAYLRENGVYSSQFTERCNYATPESSKAKPPELGSEN